MKRRQFLVLTVASIGGALVYSLDGSIPSFAAAQKKIRIRLRFFSQSEAQIIAAVASRIFPGHSASPGAREASVVIYIDRQLAGPWGSDRHRYTQGPFDENAPPEFGYQGSATPQQAYREGLKQLADFDQLSATEQDQKLKQIEKTHFFSVLRRNTIEGMFCDPLHGGNTGMVGWKLVGFPGPRWSNFADVDKHYGEAFRPTPVSLSQMTRRKIILSEDER